MAELGGPMQQVSGRRRHPEYASEEGQRIAKALIEKGENDHLPCCHW